MSEHGFLVQAFVYLGAAVLVVPIAQRLGLGSVLGYLLAGVAIGPFGLALLGTEREGVMEFAGFGVVMMMFVIGLELHPARLWRLRGPILGMGGLQVAVTSLLIMAAAMAFGLAWQAALAVGMTLTLSSTVIALQALSERGLLKTAGGQASFAVLLFEDIAVLPMLALFPLLATAAPAEPAAGAGAATVVAGLPAWMQTLAVLGAVAAVVVAGHFGMRPLFRSLARTRLREVFTAAVLLLVIGIALLMTWVGLSPALGTFLAGVVLANSEYRHELESDIEPFKGLLLGLFFLAVGASIDFALVLARPLLIVGILLGVVAIKLGVLLALARLFRLGLDQGLLFALALSQVGEFAFVLFAFANQQGVLGPEVTAPLVAVAALSMALTPLLLILNERVLQPRVGTRRSEERAPDAVEEENPVLIAGFGGFGATVGRLLRANGVAATVLDFDSDRVELLRRLGLQVYYGDARRHDLLDAAGAGRARLLIVALDTPENTLKVVHVARRHFPHLRILARAFDWQDAHDLLEAGVAHVYREALDTSLRMGTDALRMLGFRAHRAHRAAQRFLRHDEESVRELTTRRADRAVYLNTARQRIEELERMLLADIAEPGLDRDAGWDAESLREEARGGGLAPVHPAAP